ncbi:MAG: class I SAM-dependent methyltransferase [Rhizomicrobium sp.]
MSEGRSLKFNRIRPRLKPPLCPDPQIVSAYARAIAGHDERVLLMGVTEELADLGKTTVALDISRTMIADAWPGDTEKRKAVRGNWLDMPFDARQFTAVAGDGVLAAIGLSDYATLAAQFAKVLVPGARIALRTYVTPEPGETVAEVRDAAMAGKIAGFHAFKWRLAMALAHESKSASVPVAQIHEAFERAFADRATLAAATGWSQDDIAEIDAYAGKVFVYQFPTRREILAHLPASLAGARFQSSGDYELAERCPLLVADFAP